METFLVLLAAQMLPAVGVLLMGLATWGISLIKKKTDSEVAKNALNQVDRVIGAVVGQLSQTVADDLKANSRDGRLTDEQKMDLKNKAILQVNSLLTENVVIAAARTVSDLQAYINQKIEQEVLAQKK